MAQHTITLTNGVDTFINYNSSSTNYGSENYLLAQKNRKIFLKFFLDAIPQGKKIVSATLKMYIREMSSFSVNDDVNFKLYLLNGPWDENTVTGNDNVPFISDSYKYIMKINKVPNQWISCDITDYVTDWNNGTVENNGLSIHESFSLYMYSDSVYVKFNSFEYSSNKPTLTIVYEDQPPEKPHDLSPSNTTKRYDEDISLSWQTQRQTKYELQYSIDNEQTWVTIQNTTEETTYTIPANTILNTVTMVWKVRAFDLSDMASEWTQTSFTIIGKPQTPVITNGNTLEIPELVLNWEENSEQVSYRIIIDDFYDSGEVVGTEHSLTIPKELENQKEYTIKLMVKNQYDIWSDSCIKTISTEFPEPGEPDLVLNADQLNGSIRIQCTKTDGILETDHFEIFRKEEGETEYIRIADNISTDYDDYAIRCGKTYSYIVRAVASSGQYKDSLPKSQEALLRNAQIALTSDYSNHINLTYNKQIRVIYNQERESMQFSGRKKPVPEFGEALKKVISIKYLARKDMDVIEALLTANEILLYRDTRGRKVYCTLTNLEVNDLRRNNYNISFTLEEVDYKEVL